MRAELQVVRSVLEIEILVRGETNGQAIFTF